MGFPKFPPKPNPAKAIGKFIRGGVEGMQGAVDEIDQAMREIGGSMPSEIETERPSAESITDEETLRYQLDLIVDELQHLETEHLPMQGRIAGKPCDCIAKAARGLRRHAKETIPIAARQGKDTSVYSQMATWADGLMQIGTLDAVVTGEYDEEYLKQAGTASDLRKVFQKLLGEAKPKGFRETCEECGALEDLKSFIKSKEAENGKS